MSTISAEWIRKRPHSLVSIDDIFYLGYSFFRAEDMYLYPPSKGNVDPMNQADRANWIRIRRMGTHYRIF